MNLYRKLSHAAKPDEPDLRERLQSGDFREKELLIRSVGVPAWMSGHEEYWLQMTGKQLSVLAGHPLATIGCHGYYHNDLGRISLSRAVEELRQNREYLNRITNKEPNALAFPYGSYTIGLVAEAKPDHSYHSWKILRNIPSKGSTPPC
jgi:peptidoglycan/xylan/chitin deacetylase (PgdA/CDA1 family)